MGFTARAADLPPDVVQIDYDNDGCETIYKVNDVLKAHGLVFVENDKQPKDGCLLLTLTKLEGGDAPR